jgi:hypothetical protein
MRIFFSLFLLLCTLSSVAQKITGIVTDARTGEPLPFVNVYYKGGKIGVQTNEQGNYSITYHPQELFFSCVGYETQRFTPKRARTFNVMLQQSDMELGTAVVTGQKKKYSRKNNPAVELMKKVIERKNTKHLNTNDYYSFERYNKLILSINNISDSVRNWKLAEKYPFLYNHVETCNYTGKRILPISVDEQVEREIYRKATNTQKVIVMGKRTNGINDIFTTGDILNTLLQECFTQVDINEDKVRLLQYPFISPLSTNHAIGFYRYFLQDTLMVEGQKCIDVAFTPNNPQDFGFSGHLYVMADSTYRVHRADLTIPKRSDVNFVESMRIIQNFKNLPSGEQVLSADHMILELSLIEGTQSMQVKRATNYSNYSLAHIDDAQFDFPTDTRIEPSANLRNTEFWAQHRMETLTDSEENMQSFVQQMQKIKGFKAVLWVLKAFVENFVETSTNPEKPSKIDIGPVNTIFSQNFVEGYRLRASLQTTAALHPQLFFKGYGAYGKKDHKWKGSGEFTYSFKPLERLPHEFPMHKVSLTLYDDVVSPSDKFMTTDKDNVFTSFKWTPVEHMLYTRFARLAYTRETEKGLGLTVQAKVQREKPTAELFYQPLSVGATPTNDQAQDISKIKQTEISIALTYHPGVTYVNTKQRRVATNDDAPKLTLQHTTGFKGVFGSTHRYNFSEIGLRKRFWTPSWGRIDVLVKGGAQWNKVPYPYLIVPAANLSYIKDDNTFSLLTNMEFFNDRYASLFATWDLNGKIFNRLPLIKHLKLREYIGVSALWGDLTSKNNPFLSKNANSEELYHFPGYRKADGTYHYISSAMNPKKPYVEAFFGLYNIFKVFNLEYVRRLTYTDNPETDRWGIRGRFVITF